MSASAFLWFKIFIFIFVKYEYSVWLQHWRTTEKVSQYELINKSFQHINLSSNEFKPTSVKSMPKPAPHGNPQKQQPNPTPYTAPPKPSGQFF
jgi:hypothetical protein